MSTYDANLVFTRREAMDIVDIHNDIYTIIGGKSLVYVKYGIRDCLEILSTVKSELLKLSKKYCVISANGTHSCRETLLSAVRYVVKAYEDARSDLDSPIIYFSYSKEGGNSLSEERVTLIGWFGNKFFGEFTTKYKIHTYPGKIVLAYRYSALTVMRDLWTVSLFLYLFRNIGTLAKIREDFEEDYSANLTQLFNYLSIKFLENPGWGGTYNSPLALSLFSYAMEMLETNPFIEQGDYFVNGPANAAVTMISTSAIISYIKTVFFNIEGVKNVEWNKYMVESIPNVFLSGFKSIYTMIWNEKSLKNKYDIAHKKLKELSATYDEED